ncbi:MAG: heavy metal translocating P-type ATPase metal-binding domain-containing protein [Bacteroidota bacterium]
MIEPQTHIDLTCAHCGDPCPKDDTVWQEGTAFCCNGCKTVYELLHSCDLTDYYRIEETPGLSLRQSKAEARFTFLDHEEIQCQLLDFSDGTLAKVRFYLPQIHCASCVWLLEKLYRLNTAVMESSVNYLKKEVRITFYENEITLRELVTLLAQIGYEPVINLEATNQPKKTSHYQRFYLQIGVAGFCFGNIMLFSFPEYLGIEEQDAFLRNIFGYLNWVLALPVLLFSARDYLNSAFQALRQGGVNIDVPVSLGILSIFGWSSYEIFVLDGGGYLDSLSALVFLLLCGKWFQQKTFDNISFERDYQSYFPLAVTRLHEGEEESIPIAELSKGDRIRVHHQELIPADAVLISGKARIDYGFVTGESDPVRRQGSDLLYAGGRQTGETLELEVVKEVSQSYLTGLWQSDTFQKPKNELLETLTNRIGKSFTLIILLVASITAVYWSVKADIPTALQTFTAVLIIACPCALALNVPFTLGNVMRLWSRQNFYLKDTSVIERMARLSHLVFDKTGTLTSGGTAEFIGKPLSESEIAWVRKLTASSVHPVSRQIQRSLTETEAKFSFLDFEEVTGEGVRAKIDGIEIRLGKASFVDANETETDLLETRAFLQIGDELQGYFILRQAFRKGTNSLLDDLKKVFSLSLLSGDHEGTRAQVEAVFGTENTVLLEQSPQEKMAYIQNLQAKGEKVLMLGDGLNDAGALKQSEVGIALAEDVHQFSPACSAILQADSLEKLPELLRFSRRAMRVVYVGFGISFLYNLVGLFFAVQGLLSPLIAAILMPLSSITVVFWGMGMTSFLFQRK